MIKCGRVDAMVRGAVDMLALGNVYEACCHVRAARRVVVAEILSL